MQKHWGKIIFISILCISLSSTNCLSIVVYGENQNVIDSFETGPSYSSVVPLCKSAFVQYNENSLMDDYAYLACLPTTVFNNDGSLVSYPLLFYQDEVKVDSDIKMMMNSSQGIEYFMEDWMGCCDGNLDLITSINVKEKDIKKWKAKDYFIIEDNNIFNIAKKIALHDWSYSDDAVVAVVKDDVKSNYKTVSNKIEDKLLKCNVKNLPTMTLKQENFLKPIYEDFSVKGNYKHIFADCWWDALITKNGKMLSYVDPTGDPDILLYLEDNGIWMQSSANCDLIKGPIGHKYAQSHMYENGNWKIQLVDIPTENSKSYLNGAFSIQGSLLNSLLSKFPIYYVDISLFPGEDILLPDIPGFGCTDVEFRLTWNDPSANLGFSINGPGGEAIFTAYNNNMKMVQEVSLNYLGEGLNEEGYSISVFSTNDLTSSVNFEIEYSWKEESSKENCNYITSAAEGSILACMLNSPLLYTTPSELNNLTKDVLYKLGVENIYVVDIGNHLVNQVKDQIKEIGKIKSIYKTENEIYDEIRNHTNSNDVIFARYNGWTSWNFGELKPSDEKQGALFVGPAAYLAAHHGSPLILIENHPPLSCSINYHNELWSRYSDEREHHCPSSFEMIKTGNIVYDFLDEFGFDGPNQETIITVAGQYDIGLSWDRMFVGVAKTGRFFGAPIDVSYWISRNIFYPALIFENPALNDKVELVNGSVSTRLNGFQMGSLGGILLSREPLISLNINNFKKTQKSRIEEYSYPVLCSFISYPHRFNERASIYYQTKYSCADGLTPGLDISKESIDKGTIYRYTGETIGYFPDMSTSEIVPFYLSKGGYECAFSTEMNSVVGNLNKGVILWIHSSHGSEEDGGNTYFWNPTKGFQDNDNYPIAKIINFQKRLVDISNLPGLVQLSNLIGVFYYIRASFFGFDPIPGVFNEDNPWRGYEWYTGSTDEPDTMSIDIKGVLPYTGAKTYLIKTLPVDWVTSSEPVKTFLNRIIPILNPFNVNDMYDGIVGSVSHSLFQYHEYNSKEIEKNLQNLHSTGFITNICQNANTYLHMMIVRHGSVFQVMNPWSTSIFSSVWQQSMSRDIVLGYSVGEAYARGISHTGSLYLGKSDIDDEPQIWWDTEQNVLFYGDPNLRIYVPGSEYCDNNWRKPDICFKNEIDILNGHTPFGAENYPNSRQPLSIFEKYLVIIIFLIVATVVLLIAVFYYREKMGDKNG